MKEENSEEEIDQNDEESWIPNNISTNIPFSNFYINKGISSLNQTKLSEQLTNT